MNDFQSVMTHKVAVIVTMLALCLSAGVSHAEEFCFSMAESYYEQVYCEVQAAGKGNRLPSFRDFQNNEPITQALLLKRPAARSDIKISMPPKKSAATTTHATVHPALGSASLPGCRLEGQMIACGVQRYAVTGNVGNSRLKSGVLEAANRLSISSVDEAMARGMKESDYLPYTYRVYLEKMLEIGLSGATFSYGKFAYFYQDASERGVSFAERLETMFRYLKQDKRRIGVIESLPDTSSVDMTRCDRAGPRMIVCPSGRKNLVFVATTSLASSG